MIKFNRIGGTVRALITGQHPISDREFIFEASCAAEAYAQLLMNNLHHSMNDTLRGVRQEAYEQGWDDAKKRKPKRSWFTGAWKAVW